MSKSRSFYYIVDKLTADRAEVIRKGLNAITGVDGVKVSVNRGMVEVTARKDLEAQVRIACEVAGAVYRTRAQL
ncbi:MAG TPA: hypothetical protein VMW87_11645 [Spirochaetia bacterium]|nr:hypothetical protein [Spirochaetia bacterium]